MIARAILVSAILASASMVTAGDASASVDYYCNSCFIPGNGYAVNPRYHKNTESYVHYLGTGSRWMGAGAWQYGSFIWGWTEVWHTYAGTVNAQAAAGFSGTQSGATSNAHALY